MEKCFRLAVSAAVFAFFAVAAVADTVCPNPPTASNGGPSCPGGTISLFATSADPIATYLWSGPNCFMSDQQNPTISPADVTNSGAYTVNVNGCTATTTVVVNPNASINAPTWVTTTSTGNTASGPDGASSYAWSVSGNGALASDPTAQTVTFTAGSVGTMTLTLNTGCSTTSQDVTVDAQPTININSVSGKTGPKGTLTPFIFTISLSAPSTQTVTVEYYTSNQTAVAGKDYQSTSGTAVFPPLTTTQTVTVNVYGTTTNTQKTFLLNLYNPMSATIQTLYGYPVRGKGTILAK